MTWLELSNYIISNCTKEQQNQEAEYVIVQDEGDGEIMYQGSLKKVAGELGERFLVTGHNLKGLVVTRISLGTLIS